MLDGQLTARIVWTVQYRFNQPKRLLLFFFQTEKKQETIQRPKCNQCTYIIHLNNEYNEKKIDKGK